MKNIINNNSASITTVDRASFFATNMGLIQPMLLYVYIKAVRSDKGSSNMLLQQMDPTIIFILFCAHNSIIIWCKWRRIEQPQKMYTGTVFI